MMYILHLYLTKIIYFYSYIVSEAIYAMTWSFMNKGQLHFLAGEWGSFNGSWFLCFEKGVYVSKVKISHLSLAAPSASNHCITRWADLIFPIPSAASPTTQEKKKAMKMHLKKQKSSPLGHYFNKNMVSSFSYISINSVTRPAKLDVLILSIIRE